jgi:hypothetical protein
MEVLSLLRRAHQAGLAVALSDDQVIVRGPKQAEPLVRLLAEHKTKIREALSEAVSWPARHREALAHWSALHSALEAESLAWGEMQGRWRRLHGPQMQEWQCAGCGEPIGGLPSLDLQDGARVHLEKIGCLIRYGERWRGEATRALVAMGLRSPAATGVS